MERKKRNIWIVYYLIVGVLLATVISGAFGAEINWDQNTSALEMWKNMPLGCANSQINKMFKDEGFGPYLKSYLKYKPLGGYNFNFEGGVNIVGPLSQQNLTIPFASYFPLPEGPIGDSNKTYRIGFLNHSLAHPWLLNLSDSAQWEANRHSNVEIIQMDAEFDDAKQSQQMDSLISKKVDGVVIWPRVGAASVLPVERAMGANIPVVSVDRMVDTENISSRIYGNFAANGTLLGMYIAEKLNGEGNIVLLRKAKGGTADTQRTGNFLKVLSHFPGIKIISTNHTMEEDREEAAKIMLDVLTAHPNDIDVIFTTGAEHMAGVLIAMRESDRFYKLNGEKVLLVTPDASKELLKAVEDGELDAIAPYTPLIGDIAVRVLLKIIGGEDVPKDIISPDLPLITQKREIIAGFQTITYKEWEPFAYGPEFK